MRRYADADEVDLVVVGAGAGGSVLTQRLARAGWRVVCLDAGPFWDPDTDWVSDERGSHTLYWTEPRQIGGDDPVPFGSNNSGRGVGGSMIHYAGYTPRFHPSDFRTHSRDGVGADWPIDYPDLKPYYEQIEAELPVAGQDWPWGDPHRYPHRPHPVGGNGDVFLRGALAAGIQARVGPVAIPNGRFGNRPHCIYRGFCLQGCKVNAKASPLITHIPDALAHGAEIRADSHVSARHRRRHAPAPPPVSPTCGPGWSTTNGPAAVVVAGYSIETPRLLLLSTTGRSPGRPGQRPRPGRPLPDGAGRPADRRPVRRRDPHVQGTTAGSQQRTVLRDRPDQAVPAGLVHPDGQPAADHLGRTRHRARTLGSTCCASTCATTCTGPPSARSANSCPSPATGSPWPSETDRHGLPVAHFSYSQCDNDKQLMKAAQASRWRPSCTPPAPTRS